MQGVRGGNVQTSKISSILSIFCLINYLNIPNGWAAISTQTLVWKLISRQTYWCITGVRGGYWKYSKFALRNVCCVAQCECVCACVRRGAAAGRARQLRGDRHGAVAAERRRLHRGAAAGERAGGARLDQGELHPHHGWVPALTHSCPGA